MYQAPLRGKGRRKVVYADHCYVVGNCRDSLFYSFRILAFLYFLKGGIIKGALRKNRDSGLEGLQHKKE
jgi:hypothetical protein